MSRRAPDAVGLELTARMFGGLVDLIAVERVLTGGRPKPALTDAEQKTVVRQLLSAGYGPSMVARRLGVSGTVARALVDEVRPLLADASCGG